MNSIHSTRRTLLAGMLGGATLAAVRPALAADNNLTVASAPLELIDPQRPLDHYYEMLRTTLFNTKMSQIAVERCWQAYTKTADQKYAEWAALYSFNYWRMVPLGDKRVRAARIGRKLSERYRSDYPRLAAGHFWTATFLGLEAISRGILDAAHLIPEYQKHLQRAADIDETYFYAAPIIAQAKLFIKAPKFPISIGDIDKGLEYLEMAKPYQKDVFAMWYVFKAEADYLTSGKDKAWNTLAQMSEVKPIDAATQYAYEMSVQDAKGLKQAITDGTYNKYKWDPLLTPLHISG